MAWRERIRSEPKMSNFELFQGIPDLADIIEVLDVDINRRNLFMGLGALGRDCSLDLLIRFGLSPHNRVS